MKIFRPSRSITNLSSSGKRASVRHGIESIPSAPQFSTLSSELSTMISIKDKYESFINCLIRLKTENSVSEIIVQKLEPRINTLQNSFESFYQAGVKHFRSVSLQDNSSVERMISPVPIKTIVEKFKRDWELTSRVINEIGDQSTPPHYELINTKIAAIKSLLDYILKINDQLKVPSPILKDEVNNLHILSDGLLENLQSYLKRPDYSEYKSNMLNHFETDIKSFFEVVSDRFASAFVKSGVTPTELNQLKASIFAECSELIKILKAAFSFPMTLQDVKTQRDVLNIELQLVFTKLSKKYATIASTTSTMSLALTENTIQEEIEKPKPIKIQYKSEIADYYTACQRVNEFSIKYFMLIGEHFDRTADTWKNLNSVFELAQQQKEQLDDLRNEFRELKLKHKQIIEAQKESDYLLQQKAEIYQNVADQKNNEIIKTNQQIIELKKQIAELEDKLNNVQQQNEPKVDEYDPFPLRMCIKNIWSMHGTTPDNLMGDEDLMRNATDACKKYVNDKENEIDELKSKNEYLIRSLSQIVTPASDKPEEMINNLKLMMENTRHEANLVDDVNDELKLILLSTIHQLSPDLDSLGDKSPKELLPILRSQLIIFQNMIQQSFEKKEQNYIKTLKQIVTKLSALNEAPNEEIDDPNLQTLRSKLLDEISKNLKLLRQKLQTQDQTTKALKEENEKNKLTINNINHHIAEKFNFQSDIETVVMIDKIARKHLEANENLIKVQLDYTNLKDRYILDLETIKRNLLSIDGIKIGPILSSEEIKCDDIIQLIDQLR